MWSSFYSHNTIIDVRNIKYSYELLFLLLKIIRIIWPKKIIKKTTYNPFIKLLVNEIPTMTIHYAPILTNFSKSVKYHEIYFDAIGNIP